MNNTHSLHENCIICKSNNSHSLGMTYFMADDWLYSNLTTCDKLQGYDGIVHGGVIAAMFDAVMVNYLLHHEIVALTAEMNIRYKEPLHINQQIQVRATLFSHKKSLYFMQGEIICEQQLMATANAKFIKI